MDNNTIKTPQIPPTWKWHTSNSESWEAMLVACKNARSTIDFEIFIFTPDEIGRRFINVFADAVKRGVTVRLLWDAAGSFMFFRTGIIEELKSKGIQLVFFKNLLPGLNRLHDFKSWYLRNHRRTLVVDSTIGFTGSTSISTRMTEWRDTMVQIEGPVVDQMQTLFNKMWLRANNKRQRKTQIQNDKEEKEEFEYVYNDPTPRRHFLYRRVLEAIRTAEKHIYITVPYLIPTHRLARALRHASLRGVDVRIMLPVASDFPLVDIGGRTFFHQFLKAGIRIYAYKDKMLHTKSISIDDTWSTIGTLNLDHISLMYNFEANLVSTHPRFAQDLKTHFYEDTKNCEEITQDHLDRQFFVEKIAMFFVRFIRVFL